MMNILRNIIGFVVGIGLGGGINMAIVILGPTIIPPPPGVDVTSAQSLSAFMHLYEPKHFVAPFMAHAFGTLSGALIGYLIAATYQSAISYGIGTLFLAGGIAASFIIPAPSWFIVLDLVVAYIPMAWIAVGIGRFLRARFAGARVRRKA